MAEDNRKRSAQEEVSNFYFDNHADVPKQTNRMNTPFNSNPPSSKRRRVNGEEIADGEVDDQKPAAAATTKNNNNTVNRNINHGDESDTFDNSDNSPSLKLPANRGNSSVAAVVKKLPLAPSLEEYLKNGGYEKYAPRPEWCHFSKKAASTGVGDNGAAAGTTAGGGGGNSGAAAGNAVTRRRQTARTATIQGVAAVAGAGTTEHYANASSVRPIASVSAGGGNANAQPADLVRSEGWARMGQGALVANRALRVGNVGGGDNRMNVENHQPWQQQQPNALGNPPPLNNNNPDPNISAEMQQMASALMLAMENAAAMPEPRRPTDTLASALAVAGVPMEESELISAQAINAVQAAFRQNTVAAADNIEHHRQHHHHHHHHRNGINQHNNGMLALRLNNNHNTNNNVHREAAMNAVNAAGVMDPQVSLVVERAVSQWFLRRREQEMLEDQQRRQAPGDRVEIHVDNIGEEADRVQDAMEQDDNNEFQVGSEDGFNENDSNDDQDDDDDDDIEILEDEPSASNNTTVAVYGMDFDSALHVAIRDGPPEASLALIRSGANVNFPNAKGVTPLMTASLEGNVEVVHELLERGALPNAVTLRGSTALIQASHFGKYDVVKELLKYGALPEQANYKNTTALMRACQEGHEVRRREMLLLFLLHHT